MESAIATTIDLFHEHINTKKKAFIARALICLIFFLFGLTMVTRVSVNVSTSTLALSAN